MSAKLPESVIHAINRAISAAVRSNEPCDNWSDAKCREVIEKASAARLELESTILSGMNHDARLWAEVVRERDSYKEQLQRSVGTDLYEKMKAERDALAATVARVKGIRRYDFGLGFAVMADALDAALAPQREKE